MRSVVIAAAATLIGFGSAANASMTYHNQSIAAVQIDARPCLFFNLNGVSQADPAVPGQTWFAVPTSNPNYSTYASVLLSGKVAGRQVYVITDGSVTCGYATASVVGFD